MTATQTSAVMRQWDTQWILKTTILKYYRCPAPDTKSTAGLKNLSCCLKSLWQKFLTNPNLPGPMWKYPVYAHLSYISLVYLCLMLKLIDDLKMCEKYAKTNKQGKGQILFGTAAEMHVWVKVYDSVSCTAADICAHPSLCLGLSNYVFLLGCSSHR